VAYALSEKIKIIYGTMNDVVVTDNQYGRLS